MNRIFYCFCLCIFTIPMISLASNSVTISYQQIGVKLQLEFTRGPWVLEESIAKISLIDIKTGEPLSFNNVNVDLDIHVKSLSSKSLAPSPQIHGDYQDDKNKIASRFFFTAQGKWKITVGLKKDGKKENQSFVIAAKNRNIFPKDAKSFPYVGKEAHWTVGLLGGTGCRRRWDFVDTHDSLHNNKPYDFCDKFVMVSNRYHKWVDLSQYGHKIEKLQLSSLEGDAVIESLQCESKEHKFYKLMHYPRCGGKGKVIAFCDSSGNKIDPTKHGCEAK